MNWLFTEGQILTIMLNFIEHPSFSKEKLKLNKKVRNLEKGLNSFYRLCEVQFHPLAPKQVISPAKLHRVTQNDRWTIWKVELVVPGLRPNQFPRVWFAVQGASVAFVCLATHIANYSDNEMNKIAVERVSDIF